MSGDSGEGGSMSAQSSKPEMITHGDRIIFKIPLIPGETTIVSWKKLMKEANLTTGPDQFGLGPSPVEAPSSSSGKQLVGEAGSSRLSNVIEKIERMNAGGAEIDSEGNIGLESVPNDDEYDTDDSFIDDSELNEYFMVDNSKLKHEGFFVHRGKLEHIEPTESTACHVKKMRHSDMLSGAQSEADPSTLLYNDPCPHEMEGSLTAMVEVAIKELEKTVAEFAPPTTEPQYLDHPFQAAKKRLSPEIMEKITKVAELTTQENNDGKVPKDVINRLMGIVGHLIKVRNLKRILKDMADMKFYTKSKKEKQVLKIKKEVADMIKVEQRARAPNSKDSRHKHKLDKPLEDKIYDLYQLYLEGKIDTGPPLVRVYYELRSLWPAGFMKFSLIRRVIDRARRRRELQQREGSR